MNSAGITGNVPVSGPATVPQGERAGLDKKLGTDSNMFLQLLVAQMRYQDPLSSNQDTGQMITQLALFTLLESVIKVQQAAEKQGYASEQMMTLNLLNRRVEIIDEEGEIISGPVTAVSFDNQRPYLTVNEREFPYSALLRVEGGSAHGG